MDEDSPIGRSTKWGLGALGLGAVLGAFAIPKYGMWIALAVLVLFLLLFGGYFLWSRRRAKKKRENFTSAIEAQTAATPKSISDPNKRAALDKLRQKFQQGMREFKSRGKDIYKLPWYVIIGEPGSGKSEAIRHSGVEFPPGLQDEMQGSGGTVNMDWWFTNRGIILDTAGSMIFNEAKAGESAEWKEFLRLLQKARPQCPINGLFLVLSIESLIRDSADTIAQKASRLAQQLDLIQRALDVRFPVYLLVTKADLLTGFREFFDNIDDPLLQHQMFGWSNPEPLDAHFRPDMVEQYLKSMTDRLRRRRLALMRDTSTVGRLGGGGDTLFFTAKPLGAAQKARRRTDEVDSMVALTDSIMRLAPRLRRYLETVFVAGEWSAKPVFLRGIYFTSSMREGKALDEAIALATGLPLDELPEDRSWSRDRAFFLRDLFVEKVFRESGLVTRATNTLQMLRKRQFAIFGTAGVALLLLLGFAGFAYHGLKRSIKAEADYWRAGTTGWDNEGNWKQRVIQPGPAGQAFHFAYTGTNHLEGAKSLDLSLLQYQSELKRVVETGDPVGLIFKPIELITGGIKGDRQGAQRRLFEEGVLKPLVLQTRNKLTNQPPATSSPESLRRYRDALVALIQLEADQYPTNTADKGYLKGTGAAQKYLGAFLSFLTDGDYSKPDTNLVDVFAWTYSKAHDGDKGVWPPKRLLGGDSLAKNTAIQMGLAEYRNACRQTETTISNEVARLNQFTDALIGFETEEQQWLNLSGGWCDALAKKLGPSRQRAMEAWNNLNLAAPTNRPPLTNLTARYSLLETDLNAASEQIIGEIRSGLPAHKVTEGLFREIDELLSQFRSDAVRMVTSSRAGRQSYLTNLDNAYLARAPYETKSLFEQRWALYDSACALSDQNAEVRDADIGARWEQFKEQSRRSADYDQGLKKYDGALAGSVTRVCNRIAGQEVKNLQKQYVANYVTTVSARLSNLAPENLDQLRAATDLLKRINADLGSSEALGAEADQLKPLRALLSTTADGFPDTITSVLRRSARFPVVLTSTSNPMSGEQLAAFRKAIDRIKGELQAADSQQLLGRDSFENVNQFSGLVDALVTAEGDVSEMTVSFVSPETGTPDWRVASIFGEVQIGVGTGKDAKSSAWKYPFDVNVPTVAGSMSLPITVRFRRTSESEPESFVEESWPLVRLIAANRAKEVTDGDGTVWRCRIPVKVQADDQTFEGDALLKISVKRPLPKPDSWPGR